MSAQPGSLPITPDTRVGALLEAHPRLEDTLIALAPAFAKLRNPILRRTVAKVTTLRQAARVGKLPLATLISSLREAAGVTGPAFEGGDVPGQAGPPDWFDEERIVASLDVRPVIEAGESPMATVLSRLESLKDGEVLELLAPFEPAPLMDMAAERGFAAWHREAEPGLVKVYFTREPKAGPAS